MELSENELRSIFECISDVDGSNFYEAAGIFLRIVRTHPKLEPTAKAVWEEKFKRQVPWSQDL